MDRNDSTEPIHAPAPATAPPEGGVPLSKRDPALTARAREYATIKCKGQGDFFVEGLALNLVDFTLTELAAVRAENEELRRERDRYRDTLLRIDHVDEWRHLSKDSVTIEEIQEMVDRVINPPKEASTDAR